MDQAKFKKIEDAVRIGGKGSVRRKHKRAPTSTALEEKRLQTTLTKLSLFQMPGIEQMTLLMRDKSEIVVPMPKVQGSSGSNLLVVSGVATRVPSAASKDLPGQAKPPPVPASLPEKKLAKKPKKPRNRLRARNKRAQQQQLYEGAGDAGSLGGTGAEGSDPASDPGSDPGSPDERSLGAGSLDDGGGDDSGDSEKTTVPSDGSDMDQTIVGVGTDDSLDDFDMGDEPGAGIVTGTGNEEAQERVLPGDAAEIMDNDDADGDDEDGDDDDEDDQDHDHGDSEDDHMTLDDVLSSLE